MVDVEKTLLPQDIEAEQCVLGAVLHDVHALDVAGDLLTGQDFYRQAHRRIWEAMITLVEEGNPIETLSIKNTLEAKGCLKEVGGASYVASLLNTVPNAANVRYHARVVKSKALLRGLITACQEGIDTALGPPVVADELLDLVQRRLFDLADHHVQPSGAGTFAESLSQALTSAETIAKARGKPTGLATGFPDLDWLTGGLQPGQLVVIAGRPSTGKTSIALQIAERLAVEDRTPILFFSLESSPNELAFRCLLGRSRISRSSLRQGAENPTLWHRLGQTHQALVPAPIIWEDASALTIFGLKGKVRRHMTRQRPGLIVVDYLQLLQAGQKTGSRNEEVTLISRGLKNLAMETKVPVLVLSQLSRASDKDQRKPRLSDLRDSGAIEQDADIVAFLHRANKHKGLHPEPVELLLEKQRNGPIGQVNLLFWSEYARFNSEAKEGKSGKG